MRPFLLALLAIGCAGSLPPKRVLADYLEAEQRGRYADAHALLASDDQAARSLDAYVEDHLRAGPVWLEVAERTTFTPAATTRLDDHLRVEVLARHPDLRAVAEGVPGLPTEALARSTDPAAEMRRHVEATLETQAFPPAEETLVYGLKEEEGAWRVWLGLARQDAAVAAVRRARATAEAGDADATRQAWEAVLVLPEDPQGAVATLKAEARRQLAPPAP
ncbi:MAG: hypothetical protein H6732_12795 [Alphaproteobacteria bacterium]|nr:hypothetical protein [Alphaproteobacteria bacterium]